MPAIFCPVCGERAARIGTEIVCRKCNLILGFTKVRKTEPDLGISERLVRLEKTLQSLKPKTDLDLDDDERDRRLGNDEDEPHVYLWSKLWSAICDRMGDD